MALATSSDLRGLYVHLQDVGTSRNVEKLEYAEHQFMDFISHVIGTDASKKKENKEARNFIRKDDERSDDL